MKQPVNLKSLINSRLNNALVFGSATIAASGLLGGCGQDDEVSPPSVNITPTIEKTAKFTTLTAVAAKTPLTGSEVNTQLESLNQLKKGLDDAYGKLAPFSRNIAINGSDWVFTNEEGKKKKEQVLKSLNTLSETLQTAANSDTHRAVREDLQQGKVTTQEVINFVSATNKNSDWNSSGSALPAAWTSMSKLMDFIAELQNAVNADIASLSPAQQAQDLYKLDKVLAKTSVESEQLVTILTGKNASTLLKSFESARFVKQLDSLQSICDVLGGSPAHSTLRTELADVSAKASILEDVLKSPQLTAEGILGGAQAFSAAAKALKAKEQGITQQMDPYKTLQETPTNGQQPATVVHHYYPYNYWAPSYGSYNTGSYYPAYVGRDDDRARYGNYSGYRNYNRGSTTATSVGSANGGTKISAPPAPAPKVVVSTSSVQSAPLPANMANFGSNGKVAGFGTSAVHAETFKIGTNYTPGKIGGAPAFASAVKSGFGSSGARSVGSGMGSSFGRALRSGFGSSGARAFSGRSGGFSFGG